MKRLVTAPFALALVGLVVLAGWALVSAGVFDGAVAREVRASSVYVAPGVEVDEAAAERIVGNRRLVLVFLDPGADPSDECDGTDGAAAGTLVLLLQVSDDEFDTYGCAQFPGDDDENFGKAFVAEAQIASGADQFVADPLTAVKVIAVNYDGLVKAGVVPDGSRTVNPALPRYVIAGAAVLAVLGGTVSLYVAARRVGRAAAERRVEAERAGDERGSLQVRVAVLAKQIVELDRRAPRASREFQEKFRPLAADYAVLVEDLAGGDADGSVAERVGLLTLRARALQGREKKQSG